VVIGVVVAAMEGAAGAGGAVIGAGGVAVVTYSIRIYSIVNFLNFIVDEI
jgi:hypothetical protein